MLAGEGALAQALASRICHDLVSPVGAVANGAELLSSFGASADGSEIAMVAQSAERASAQLAFFRLAFGAAPAGAGEIARPALVGTVGAMIRAQRGEIEVTGEAGSALPRRVARLAALMALSARTLLRMRGTVRLVLAPGAALPVAAAIDGEADADRRAALDAALAGGMGAPEPRLVEFALLLPAAAAAGARLDLGPGDGRMTALTARPIDG